MHFFLLIPSSAIFIGKKELKMNKMLFTMLKIVLFLPSAGLEQLDERHTPITISIHPLDIIYYSVIKDLYKRQTRWTFPPHKCCYFKFSFCAQLLLITAFEKTGFVFFCYSQQPQTQAPLTQHHWIVFIPLSIKLFPQIFNNSGLLNAFFLLLSFSQSQHLNKFGRLSCK